MYYFLKSDLTNRKIYDFPHRILSKKRCPNGFRFWSFDCFFEKKFTLDKKNKKRRKKKSPFRFWSEMAVNQENDQIVKVTICVFYDLSVQIFTIFHVL